MADSVTPCITVTETKDIALDEQHRPEDLQPHLGASSNQSFSPNPSTKCSGSSCSPPKSASFVDATLSILTTQQIPRLEKQRHSRREQRSKRTLLTRVRDSFDPTKYTAPSQPRRFNPKTTVREYDRKRQKRHILLDSGTRYLASVVLCSLCAVVLSLYSDIGNEMRSIDFQWFNTLMTALPLFIALNFRMSLQSYAKILRWWILAKWEWPLRQVDLILDLASSKAVLKLMWQARRPRNSYVPSCTQLACAAWLLINFTGALSIALLSLTYDVGEPGKSVGFKYGNVSTLDLTQEALFENAYNYAVYPFSARPLDRGSYKSLELFYQHDVNTAWRYWLRDEWQGLTAQSVRSIIAHSECYKQDVLDMKQTSVTFTGLLGKETLKFSLDQEIVSNNTYLTTKTAFIHDTSNKLCFNQTRCAHIIVIAGEILFSCRNSVLESDDSRWNATYLSDNLARTLAAAMTIRPDAEKLDVAQGLVLSSGDAWSPDNASDASRVASTLSQFSMSVLAAAEQGTGELPSTTPSRAQVRRFMMNDGQPYLAADISIDNWLHVAFIIIAVPILQGIIFLVIFLLSNNIIVLDESHVCISRVLAPVSRDLEGRGSLLGVDDVVKALDRGDGVPLRYHFEETNRHWKRDGKRQKFRVGLFSKPTGRLTRHTHGKFPEGKYD